MFDPRLGEDEGIQEWARVNCTQTLASAPIPPRGCRAQGSPGPAQAGSRSQISPAQAWLQGPDHSVFPGVLGEGVSKGPAKWGGWSGRPPWLLFPSSSVHALVCARLKRHLMDVWGVDRWTNYLLPKSQVLLEPPAVQDLCKDWLRAELWAQHRWTHRTHSAHSGPSAGMAFTLARQELRRNWL